MQTFIVANKTHFTLATAVAAQLQIPLYPLETIRFADSELSVALKDVDILQYNQAIVVHSTSRSVNDTLMELLLTLQMLKNKGIKKVIAVIPYFGYGRQDKNNDGEGVAHFVMRLLREAGADRIVTVEIHNLGLLHDVPLPVTNIKLTHCIANYIPTQGVAKEWTIIAPDRGAQERASEIAHALDAPIVVCDKERYAVNKTRITYSDGMCATLKGIIIDDIIDTGSTVLHAADKLREEHSACKLSVFGIHPVLSGDAIKALQNSNFEHVWITNTISWPENVLPAKFKIVDISQHITQVLTSLI